MKRTIGRVFLGFAALAGLALAGAAWADQPHDWQLLMQDPATPIAERVKSLHDELLYITSAIVIFVLALLAYVCVRFRAKVNPIPSRTSHHTVIEILWTVLPIVILLVIAVPSFKLLYFETTTPKADLTLKVTGLQWYWHYDYPDNGNFGFDSQILDDDKLKDPSKRLLEVDNEVVLPVGANVRVQIAGQDVMHDWFVPSLAVGTYAVVGRLNETWLRIEKEGTYYGECNQICGVNHSFMPIKIHAVPQAAFDKWAADEKAHAELSRATKLADAATPAQN
ncbi:MAG TPA: cytochrome c oxidase subunit II [Aliidongia sp.]|nr:cytochrome c oxidase subunit II [Aliidongia sp.]